jgi:hypothetical protein
MIKYASLICSKRSKENLNIKIDDQTYVAPFTMNFLAPDETSHWEKWKGSLTWEDLNKSTCALVTWMKTETPEVLDGGNLELTKRMDAAWYGLLLSEGLWPFYGQSYVITGKADLDGGKVVRANIRQFSQHEAVIRPFYEHCTMEYIETFGRKSDDWASSWKDTYSLLENGYRAAGKITSVIEDALESFKDAKTHGNVATAIARYVEAAEAVIAMPKGNSGKKEFAKRAFEIMKPIAARAKKIAKKLGLPDKALIALALQDTLYEDGIKYAVRLEEDAA